ncbi:MAG: hypothetical protein V1928_04090 [Parcubacteria group bacterium]
MKKTQLSILCLYLLWGIASFLILLKLPNLLASSYIIFFQCFIPGLVVGISFGLSKRPLTEIILFSFILSYMVYLVAALPTLFFHVAWPLFIGFNVFLYLLALAIFIIKSRKGLIVKWNKPDANEIFVIALGIVVLFTFTYINFRSDATEYNNRILSSLQSKHVETTNLSHWILKDDGQLIKEPIKSFFSDYKTYFNFLALPIKYTAMDQRYGWLIFNKLFIFLSILGIYCLGKKLRGPVSGHLALLFFMVAVFIFGFYYGENSFAATGALFEHAAYGRFVAENIFLLAFYLVAVEAFQNQQRNSFLFAGLILLCMFSIHYYAFCWAAINFLLFSLIVFFTSIRGANKKFAEFENLARNNARVAVFSVLIILGLFLFTNYVNDAFYLANTMVEGQPGRFDVINNVTFAGQIKTIWHRENFLFLLLIILGIPLLVAHIIKKKDVAAKFLLSNVLLYVMAALPLVYNALMAHKLKSFAERLDASLLFYAIAAFLIAWLVNGFKAIGKFVICFAALSTVLIYVVFGTNNSFVEELRYRKITGFYYMQTTNYLNYLEKPEGRDDGFTVLTNIKTAMDVFAYLNAYTFQYRKELYGTPAISAGRKDIDRLLFYPREQDGKLVKLIEQARVDYIVIPTVKSSYAVVNSAADFNKALDFYSGLKNYKLIYSDDYYYVYKKHVAKN